MPKFDVTSILKQQSVGMAEAAVKDFNVEMILLDEIETNDRNFYTVEDVEQLAQDILINGLMHNIVVQRRGQNGKYRLISGERRYRAFCLLREKEGNGYDKIPAVVDAETDPLMIELKLISANATSRVLTDFEKTEQAARISAIVKELKAQGKELPGRTREITAQILNVSVAQAGRLEKINRDLVPEAKEKLKAGDIGVTKAYEVATMPAERQREAVKQSQKKEKPSASDKAVAPAPSMRRTIRTWMEGFDEELEDVAVCLEHWNEMARHKPEFELLKRLLCRRRP
jgi:ParB family chromosome partitioning protein